MSVLVDELLLLAQLDAGRPLAQRAGGPDPAGHRRRPATPGRPRRTTAGCSNCRTSRSLVRGDEHRLHQVLANLMSNAARHTPQGTTVTVALTDRARTPGTRRAERDRRRARHPAGPAARPVRAVRPRRLLPLHARPGSTGLGLAIVDAVTTAHGGQRPVERKPGRTRFVITLPRLDA